MKVTFIVRNMPDESMQGLTSEALYQKLHKWAYGDLKHSVKVKYGRGIFSDRVDLNRIMRNNPKFEHKIEPRRGYKLVTFNIT